MTTTGIRWLANGALLLAGVTFGLGLAHADRIDTLEDTVETLDDTVTALEGRIELLEGNPAPELSGVLCDPDDDGTIECTPVTKP